MSRLLIKHKFGLLFILACLSLWWIATIPFSILPDSADHWVWSRKFFIGFVEHPPFIAWYLSFFDVLIPNSVIAIKTASFISWGLSYVMLYWAANIYLGEKNQALATIILILSSPYFFAVPFFVSVSSCMFLFYSMYMVCIAKFFRSEHKEKWILIIGVVIGFALLSKLKALFYFVPLYGIILLYKKHWRLFTTWQLYLAPIISLIILSPYLIFNYMNDWISFRYQINRGFGGEIGINLRHLYTFLSGQVFAYGLLATVFLLWFFSKKSYWKKYLQNDEYCFWGLFFFLPIIGFTYTTTSGGMIDIQWVNTSYTSAFFFLSQQLFSRYSRKKIFYILSSNAVINGILLGILYFFLIFGPPTSVNIPVNSQIYYLTGWDESGRQASELIHDTAQRPADYIVVRKYDIAGSYSLYMEGNPFPYTEEKTERNLWTPVEELQNPAKLVAALCEPDECKDLVKFTQEASGRELKYIGEFQTKHPITESPIRHYKIYITNAE